MLVRDLFESDDPFSFSKNIQRKLKELAAANELTLKSGLGWPRHGKQGTWLGGTFAPKGGVKAAEKRGDLDLHTHVLGALSDFATYLADVVKGGVNIQVGSTAQRSQSQDMHIGPEDGEEEIFHVLKTLLHDSSPPAADPADPKGPTIVMFVERPQHLLGKVSVRLGAVFRSNHATEELKRRGLPRIVEAQVGGVMDEEDFKRFKKAHTTFNEAGHRIYPEKPIPALERYRRRLAKMVFDAAGVKVDPDDYETAYFSVDVGTFTVKTVKTDITPIVQAAMKELHL